ncbi:hypothetical protein P3T76_013144 [Phytophthora citrophthora]|uniref:CR-type domain-containing protein n=1 Tax=Phytophthora citrophthora TaxID=4793 RepID=A0AAD9LCB3_9STRA|nr:hypothetical protein P3T76_013144 [Phytophthora citrophthora]
MSWTLTPSANAGMNWLGYSSREELEASGILDKWAQQQHQSSLLPQQRSSIKLCPRCQGHRIEKVMYNSMILEQNCSECNGEGVVRSQTSGQDTSSSPKRASSA